MSLSDELVGFIGDSLYRRVLDSTGEAKMRARRMRLEWVQAIEGAYRDEEKPHIDSERMPFIITKQAG